MVVRELASKERRARRRQDRGRDPAVNFDEGLERIDGIDGAGLDLGEREPVWPDFPLAEYRRRYARLAALLDMQGLDRIVVDLPPDTEDWLAVRDRLRRAASSVPG